MRSVFRERGPHLACAWVGSAILAVTLGRAVPAPGQGSSYPGGFGTTVVDDGLAICGTDPISLNVLDGTNFSVASGSEFGVVSPTLYGVVPSPFGEDVPSASAPVFGVVVANPTASPILVSRVHVSAGATRLFRGATAVKPASGWTVFNSSELQWSGTAVVPANSALDFLVRGGPDNKTFTDIAITLSAVTDAGSFANAGFFRTTSSSNPVPAVSLVYLEGGAFAMAGVAENSGAIAAGGLKRFRLRITESEPGNTNPIPAGTRLQITIPPGWTDVGPTQSVGWNLVAISPGSGCGAGSIDTSLATPLLAASLDFEFEARAPAALGAPSLYRFDTRLTNSTTNPDVATVAQYIVAVTTPSRAGTYDGLAAPGIYVAVPNPMGKNKAGVFAAAFANPSADAITLTQLAIRGPAGVGLFKSLVAVKPATGWSMNGSDEVQWNGSLRVEAHKGLDFVVRIKGQGLQSPQAHPIEVVAFDSLGRSYSNTDGATRQDHLPLAGLYYVPAGQPSTYVPAVTNGDVRRFDVAIAEAERRSIPAGATLRVEVPVGWSDLAAPFASVDFGAATIIQPSAVPGSIAVQTLKSIKNREARFAFEARAPVGVLQSLYVFPTTLQEPTIPVDSLCEAVVQTVEYGGQLAVRHLSPPITLPVIQRLDVQLFATSDGTADYKLEVRNVARSRWEALAVATLDSTVREVLGSLSTNLPDYLDLSQSVEARIVGTSDSNVVLHEDLLTFIVSDYQVLGTDRAPITAPQGALGVPLLQLRFSTTVGLLDVFRISVRATGTAPLADVAALHLVSDADCDGFVGPGDSDRAAASAPDLDGDVLFDARGVPLFRVFAAGPSCVIVTADLNALATVDNVVGASLLVGSDIVTSVGTYPVPSVTGYPVESGLVLITIQDIDRDGLPDAEEATLGTRPRDADSDDDGLLDGDENREGTDPLNPDSDGDGLPDGLELGVIAVTDRTDGDLDGTPDSIDPAAADPTIQGTDYRIFVADFDPATMTNPLDDDGDDDGLLDGTEDLDRNGRADFILAGGGAPSAGVETDPAQGDSDGDGVGDGTERSLVAPQGTGTAPGLFVPDAHPGTTTNPLDDDSDDDGLRDGDEDADRNGHALYVLATSGAPGSGETDPLRADNDGDGLPDGLELGLAAPNGAGTRPLVFRADLDPATRTNPLDDDTDDDGLIEGEEDWDRDGRVTVTLGGTGSTGWGETDPLALDTDGDGCQDGTESGRDLAGGSGTDTLVFQPDLEPATVTSAVDTDSDDDGRNDGVEDPNCNGRTDPGEEVPIAPIAVLRNASTTALTPRAPAAASIFVGVAPTASLHPVVDLYAPAAASPFTDPDTFVLDDASRPLVFYQTDAVAPLRMVKGGSGSIRLRF